MPIQQDTNVSATDILEHNTIQDALKNASEAVHPTSSMLVKKTEKRPDTTDSSTDLTPQSYYAKYILPTLDAPQTGLPPINLNNAQLIQSKDKGKYAGLCQRYVEDATYGKHGIFDSAISAWNQLPNKVQGLQGVKPGDLVYFSPNAGNNNDGHVGIYEGNGTFKSATSNGIEDYNIGDWMQRTGQSVLGYVPV